MIASDRGSDVLPFISTDIEHIAILKRDRANWLAVHLVGQVDKIHIYFFGQYAVFGSMGQWKLLTELGDFASDLANYFIFTAAGQNLMDPIDYLFDLGFFETSRG